MSDYIKLSFPWFSLYLIRCWNLPVGSLNYSHYSLC